MALYDDASFIFLASAAAGLETKDASKVYNVKPAPVVSSGGAQDLSGFSVAGVTDSANSISVSGGVATFVGDGSEFTVLQKDSVLGENKNYKVVITANITTGAIKIQDGQTDSLVGTITESGTHTFYFTSGSDVGTGAERFRIARRDSGDKPFNFTVSDLSVFEVDVVPADFTISRDANLDATRVGPTGLIEKGRENLLLQSNGLNNSPWTPSGDSTVTTGQSGYDGSSNAFLISKVSEQFGGVNQDVTASNVHTFSAHLKAGSVNFARLFTGPANVFFDLSGSGSIGATSGTKVDATLTSIGNGWFRCTVTVSGSTSVVKINPAIGDNDLGTTGDGDNGTGTGSIFVQDCQLEAGFVATEVITTGAATATAGIKEDEPRFDYPIAGGPPSLLIEPQAINIVTHSEGITLAIKQGTGVVASAPTEASPAGHTGGVVRASNLQGATGDRARVGLSGITDGDTVSGYFYIKGDSGKTINVTLKRNGNGDHRGTTITHTCDGEWQKVGPMENVTMDGGNDQAAMFLVNSSGSGSTLDSCLLWGYQIEKTSFSTSYIPCHGSAATRSTDDVAAIDTSGFSFGTTCTIFFEGAISQFNPAASSTIPITMFASHASPNNSERYLLFASSFSSGTYTLTSRHDHNGNTVGVSKSGLTEGSKVKVAAVFNGTSQKFFVNGSSGGSGFTPSDGTSTHVAASLFESLDLSAYAANKNHTVGSVVLWGSALTDQQCIDLTTL